MSSKRNQAPGLDPPVAGPEPDRQQASSAQTPDVPLKDPCLGSQVTPHQYQVRTFSRAKTRAASGHSKAPEV
jgi:hypothetical protein